MNIPHLLTAFAMLLSTFRIQAAEACCAPSLPPADTWSDESLFHIESEFKTQNNAAVRLADLKGGPAVAAMFFASCATICPRLTAELKKIEQQLPEDARSKLRVVLISLDPERDSPEALKIHAENWKMDPVRWQLWSGEATDVRTVAAALGVRYRKTPEGEISHSAPLLLLNEEGEIDTRLDAPGGEKQKAFEQRLLEILNNS